MVSYDCEKTQGGGSRVGRIHIVAEMVEWSVQSDSREMASAMLLRKPFFKAVRLDITLSMHWKCLGPSLAHHFTQILPKVSTSSIHKKTLVLGFQSGASFLADTACGKRFVVATLLRKTAQLPYS